MRKSIVFIPSIFFLVQLFAQKVTTQQYKEDFDYFWRTLDSNYCYWDKKKTDWNKVRLMYGSQVDSITSKAGFISLLEKAFYELYDHHASLNNNTSESQRLVPSGADLWAAYRNGKAVITEVRLGSGADNAGILAGMEVIAVNSIPVETAIQNFLPKCMRQPDAEAKDFALRLLLAGKHSQDRKLTVSYQNQQRIFFPDQPRNLLESTNDKNEIESKILKGNIGYVLINNALGNNDLIGLFDSH